MNYLESYQLGLILLFETERGSIDNHSRKLYRNYTENFIALNKGLKDDSFDHFRRNCSLILSDKKEFQYFIIEAYKQFHMANPFDTYRIAYKINSTLY